MGDLENDPRSWWLSTAQNTETFKKIYELMAGEHGMTLELMKDQLHVNQEMICQILHEDSGKRKICMKFVTQSLMDEFILPC
jgi:hypothetical protein